MERFSSFEMVLRSFLPLLLFGMQIVKGEIWTIYINVEDLFNAASNNNFYLDVNGSNQDKTGIELGKLFQQGEQRQILVDAEFGEINHITIYQYGSNALRVQNITISAGSRHLDFICHCWVDADGSVEGSKQNWTLYPEGKLWTIQIIIGGEINAESGNNIYLDINGTNQDKNGIELGTFPQVNQQRQILVNVNFGEIDNVRIYSDGTDGLLVQNIILSIESSSFNFTCNCWVDGDSISTWTIYASSAARRYLWKPCKDGIDVVYNDDIKFQISVNQTWECAKSCMRYGESCSAYSIVPRNMTCYGYGEMKGPYGVPGAELWKRVCYLIGYTYIEKWGKCVKIYTEELDWDDASLACQAIGAALIRFDNNEVLYKIASGDIYWIGGRRDDSSNEWKWENGVVVDQIYWGPGQPVNAGNTCIAGSIQEKGLESENCNTKHSYLCQEEAC